MRLGVLTLLLLFLCCAGVYAPQASAEPAGSGIEIEAEAGIQGVIKDGRWTRLQATLTNRTDETVKGELVFTAADPDSGRNIDYSTLVELPPGTPIKVDMSIPGMSFNKDNNHLSFYEGSAEAGDAVKLLTSKPYIKAAAVQQTTIGVVARDPDTLNFMPLLNQKGYDIKMVPIDEEQLPEAAMQLEAVDILLLSDVATGSWDERKVQAVLGWVERGGWLAIAGGPSYAKTAEAFRDVMPVIPEGTSVLKTADTLNMIGAAKPLDLDSQPTVSTGKLREGQVSISEGGMPIAAHTSYGSGRIIYTAFDPSLEPFASWSGSPALWAFILGSQHASDMLGGFLGDYTSPVNYWEISSLLNYFPSIQPPPVGMLIIFFLIYVILVAPALYLLLKAVDRRGWAWWIIPLVSVASSVVIFYAGADNKNQMMAHNVRTVELDGSGGAKESLYAAMFVPDGGRVAVQFEPEASVVPFPEETGFGSLGRAEPSKKADTLIRTGSDGNEVVWNGVPYWSVRKIWIAGKDTEEQGMLETAFQENNQQLELQVTNRTGSSLTDVHLLLNGQAYPVGDLQEGGSGSVQVALTGNQNAGYYDYGIQIFPYPSGADPFIRERRLLDWYINNRRGAFPMQAPMLVGFSKREDASLIINGKDVASDDVTMWTQPLNTSTANGKYVVFPGSIAPVIRDTTMQSYSYDHMSATLDLTEGEMTFEYMVPARNGVAVEELDIYNYEAKAGAVVTIEIRNVKTGKWEQLDLSASKISPPGKAVDYISETGGVLMRLTSSGKYRYALPSIGLKGTVTGS
ncbi:hypothetical protein DNH61_08525 [Paenibacillus sambharensis]|uniref:DUF7408 domain-containing protein n=2 Tax=Paenibacillus sambharensis TaxID=1803190 RepID=A0A2W1LDT4_9BACL|nr:hypothetical protein DNH61_08525 [Paenibacillus sambharensis]